MCILCDRVNVCVCICAGIPFLSHQQEAGAEWATRETSGLHWDLQGMEPLLEKRKHPHTHTHTYITLLSHTQARLRPHTRTQLHYALPCCAGHAKRTFHILVCINLPEPPRGQEVDCSSQTKHKEKIYIYLTSQ